MGMRTVTDFAAGFTEHFSQVSPELVTKTDLVAFVLSSTDEELGSVYTDLSHYKVELSGIKTTYWEALDTGTGSIRLKAVLEVLISRLEQQFTNIGKV